MPFATHVPVTHNEIKNIKNDFKTLQSVKMCLMNEGMSINIAGKNKSSKSKLLGVLVARKNITIRNVQG